LTFPADVESTQRVRGDRSANTKRLRRAEERALEGQSPGRHRRAGSFGIRKGRTSSRRDRSPEGDRVRTLPRGARRIDAVNAKRAWDFARSPDRFEENALEGEAHGRSASQDAGGTVVDAARGVQTPDVARREAGSLSETGLPSRMCRRARKPRRGSIVRRRPSGPRDGVGVLRWTSEEERKRKGGRRPEQSGSARPATREPGGRRNAVRVERNPCPLERGRA